MAQNAVMSLTTTSIGLVMAKSAKSRFGYTFTLFVPLYLLTCFETLLMPA